MSDLEWRDGVPVSSRFDDPYYSLEDGLAETRHVFLAGNGLPDRFGGDFTVAELGFGTGLNFLTLVDAWRLAGSPGTLTYVSFEAFPLSAEAARQALRPFASLSPAPLSDRWEAWLAGEGAYADGVSLDLRVGDARALLPQWEGAADAWFLDGFAPSKNPELWEPALLAEVYAHTKPGGTFATYTAAGAVRRALSGAGFAVERTPGFGRKRHMSRGVK